jgi:ABC-type branched-subunit amino acid transport system ATPase component
MATSSEGAFPSCKDMVRSESSLFGRVRPFQGIRIIRNASVMEKLTLGTHKEEVKALDKKKKATEMHNTRSGMSWPCMNLCCN